MTTLSMEEEKYLNFRKTCSEVMEVRSFRERKGSLEKRSKEEMEVIAFVPWAA